ncbi:carboxymuconolactone decarboxylase family protein [Flexibacterium corallicola]|uniref:carboxymuconolactone decarboxylase family protein n=1 Tax=Flexibacterium corallicola TaxID=3037259 RepID=UPI00286F8D83|nr:carboxymuconolactone decarboxylase family protein [Pseudovibrio sp. M1P-2-3]
MTNDGNSPENLHEKGQRVLDRVNKKASKTMNEICSDLAPELQEIIIESLFGKLYSREDELGLRERVIATIAALTILGYAEPQLRVHIQSGLNVGLSKQEIIEIIMQMSGYGGFPAALNGISIAKEVFAENP